MLLSLTLIVLGTLIARAQVPAALGEMCSAAAAGRGGTVAERLHAQGHLWIGALAGTPESETRKTALDLVPAAAANLTATDINLICEAFSDVVDAKSSFTYRHSMGVTEAAVEIASGLGLSEDRARLVKRAALLHDLGKLRVPNSILDKPGKLDGQEWSVVQEHPRLTGEILSRIGNFGELASVAAGHHEKLDGSGYPHRLVASQLPIETRIIAVADVYGALTENRPYRGRYAD
jgi:putative nucleotidyltransferase with HDIG domain